MAESQVIDDRTWLVRKLDELGTGSQQLTFLRHFITACIMAESADFAILEPAIQKVRAKYPLKAETKTLLNEQGKTHGKSF